MGSSEVALRRTVVELERWLDLQQLLWQSHLGHQMSLAAGPQHSRVVAFAAKAIGALVPSRERRCTTIVQALYEA